MSEAGSAAGSVTKLTQHFKLSRHYYTVSLEGFERVASSSFPLPTTRILRWLRRPPTQCRIDNRRLAAIDHLRLASLRAGYCRPLPSQCKMSLKGQATLHLVKSHFVLAVIIGSIIYIRWHWIAIVLSRPVYACGRVQYNYSAVAQGTLLCFVHCLKQDIISSNNSINKLPDKE